jgi:hypothetical protein
MFRPDPKGNLMAPPGAARDLRVTVYRYREMPVTQLRDSDEFSLDGKTWHVCAYNHATTGVVAVYADPDAPRGSGGPVNTHRIGVHPAALARVKVYQVDIPGKADHIVRTCAWPYEDPANWRVYLHNACRIERGSGYTRRVIAPASMWRALVEYLDEVNWEFDGVGHTPENRADRRAVRLALDRITKAVPSTSELARSIHGRT